MSNNSTLEEDQQPEINKRSKEDLLDEEIRNQQTLDEFINSDKNWS